MKHQQDEDHPHQQLHKSQQQRHGFDLAAALAEAQQHPASSSTTLNLDKMQNIEFDVRQSEFFKLFQRQPGGKVRFDMRMSEEEIGVLSRHGFVVSERLGVP